MATSLRLDGNNVRFFEASPEILADQMALGVTLNVSAGATIVLEGDPIEHYFKIVSGSARLYKSLVDGRRQIIDFLGSNDYFGLTGLGFHAYSAEAINDVIVIRYARCRFEDGSEDQTALTNQLFHRACAELDRAQQRMLLLGRKSAEERLASFLIELAERQKGTLLHLPMSRQDIADFLGLTIETVSRLFTRFKRAGLIGLPDRSTVIMADSVELSNLATGAFAD